MYYDANEAWQSSNVTALKNPISEFNARGGLDLSEYKKLQDHLNTEHPYMGQEGWADIQSLLPPIETTTDPKTGQQIRFQRFNWPIEGSKGKTINVFNTAFSVPIDFDHLQYGAYKLAEAINAPLIVFENPGYGKSDKLTIAQSNALKQGGDFGPVGEAMLSILKKLSVTDINCIGYSMGSETTSAIAAHAAEPDFNVNVHRLFIMEAPRVIKQKLLMLAKNFSGGSKDLKFAWNHPVDPVLRETAKLKLARQRGAIAYARAMASGTLEKDLELALKTQGNLELIIASAEHSNISPLVANNQLTDRLKAKYPNRKIGRIVAPGETHAFGDNVELYSHMAKLVLR